MGVHYLQELVESGVISNSVTPVDLIKLAKNVTKGAGASLPPKKPITGNASQKLCLVVDGECCLNRLYGGFYSGE